MSIATLVDSEGYFGGEDCIPSFDSNGNLASDRGRPFDHCSWNVERTSFLSHKSSTISWYKQWQLVESMDFECGQGSPEFEATWTSGSEAGTKKVLDANLSLVLPPIHGVAAMLGMRKTVESTFAKTESTSRKITRKFREIPCKRLTVALWQLVHVLEINGPHAESFSKTSFAAPEVKSTSLAYRYFMAYDSRCCPEPPQRSRYVVTFPNGSEEVRVAQRTPEGMTFDGIAGKYRLGDVVPLTAFAQRRNWLSVPEGPSFTYGVLSRNSEKLSYSSTISKLIGNADVDSVIGDYVSTASKESLGLLFNSDEAAIRVYHLRREAPQGWLTVSGTVGRLSEPASISLAAPIASSLSQFLLQSPRNMKASRWTRTAPTTGRKAEPVRNLASATKAAKKSAPAKKAAKKITPATKAAKKSAPAKKAAKKAATKRG